MANIVFFLYLEHTLLVTETGVEVLTARFPNSPGGPVPMPVLPPKEVENTPNTTEVGVQGEQNRVQTDAVGSGAVLAS